MLLKAAKDFNIDLSKSYTIGDSNNDSIAGIAAGCKVIQIDTNESILGAIKSITSNTAKEVITVEQICPSCFKQIKKYGVYNCLQCKTKLRWCVAPKCK